MEAIHSEIKNGQRKIIDSILAHKNSSFFQHDFKKPKAKSASIPSDKEDILSDNKSCSSSKNNGACIVKRSLFEGRDETQSIAELLEIDKDKENQICLTDSPEKDTTVDEERWDTLSNDSYLSFTDSIPSSVSTDRPPSFTSFSSYGTQPCNEKVLDVSDVDQENLKACQVSVRKMSLNSWWGPITKNLTNSKEQSDLLSQSQVDRKDLPNHENECKPVRLVPEPMEFKTDEELERDSTVHEFEYEYMDFESNSEETDIDVLSVCDNENDLHERFEDMTDIEDDIALDLNELRSLVEGRGCSSILDLHLNINHIIDETPILGPKSLKIKQELKEYYFELMKEVYPWFEFEEPGKFWSEWEPRFNAEKRKTKIELSGRKYYVKPPNPEHSYAFRKRSLETDGYDLLEEKDPIKTNSVVDSRKCLFCGALGDQHNQLAGRILPFRFNEWAHLNCALWSSEVYETMDGSLQNVMAAASRCRTLICTVCEGRGASIGCCHRDCPSNFHFECGISAQADFKEDKTVYCLKHAQKYANTPNIGDFVVDRHMWIDCDPEEEKGRKRSKLADYRNLKFTVGSVVIDNIGTIVPASDTKHALVPVGFSAIKTFWSVLKPNTRTKYRCTTRLVSTIEEVNSDDNNVVIDHSKVSECDARKTLEEFENKLSENRKIALSNEDVIYAEDDLISPHDVSKLWPWLDYNQLRNRPIRVTVPKPYPPTPTQKQNSPNKNSSIKSDYNKRAVNNSPLKFNRAVIGFRKTPKKLSEIDEELTQFVIDDDKLIRDIINLGKLDNELFDSDASSEDSEVKETSNSNKNKEFKVCRRWYNANKMFKVREVITQTTQYYDGVQIASDNVYTNFKPPLPKELPKTNKVNVYMKPENLEVKKENLLFMNNSFDFVDEFDLSPRKIMKKETHFSQRPLLPLNSNNSPIKRIFFSGNNQRSYSYKVDSRHKLEIPGRILAKPTIENNFYEDSRYGLTDAREENNADIVNMDDSTHTSDSADSTDILSYVTKNMEKRPFGQEQIINKIILLNSDRPSSRLTNESGIPQLDGAEDDESMKMELEDDYNCKEENDDAESNYDTASIKLEQLDGAVDDDKEQIQVVDDPEDNSQQRTEIKEDDVKLEPRPSHSQFIGRPLGPPRDPRASVDSFSSFDSSRPSTAGCSSSRGPTPARTPITPMMDLEGDIPGNIVDHPVLCSTCGNTYGHKRTYEAHLPQCAAMLKLMEKSERELKNKEEENKRTQTPDSEGSPRKDFSIAGLLSSEEKEHKEEDKGDDIVILSENITQPKKKASNVKRNLMNPPTSKPKRPENAGSKSSYTPTQSESNVQYLTTPAQTIPTMAQLAAPLSTQLASQPTYLNPYGNAVIQYPYNPYGLQPSYVQQGMLAPMMHPVGGYITLPGVQPVLHQQSALQPIYYNSSLASHYGQIAVSQAHQLSSLPPSSQPSGQPAFIAPQPYTSHPVQTTQPSAYTPSQTSQQLSVSQTQPAQQQRNVTPESSRSQTQTSQSTHSAGSKPSSGSPYPEQPPKLVPQVAKKPAPQSSFSSQPSSSSQPPPRKIARVQPTPHIVRPIPTKAAPPAHRFPMPSHSPQRGVQRPTPSPTHTPTPPKLSPALPKQLDPMSALNTLSKNPMSQTNEEPTDLSITHKKTAQSSVTNEMQKINPTLTQDPSKYNSDYYQKGIVANTALNLKSQSSRTHLTPSPSTSKTSTDSYKKIYDNSLSFSRNTTPSLSRNSTPTPIQCISPKQEIIDVESRSSTPGSVWGDHEYVSSPEPDFQTDIKSGLDGVNVTTKASKTNSIKIVLQRDNPTEAYNIKEVTIKDGSKASNVINPKIANQALKIKARVSRKHKSKTDVFTVPLNGDGSVYHADNTFVNEQEVDDKDKLLKKLLENRPEIKQEKDKTEPHIMYNLTSDDGGFSVQGSDITSLWQKVFEAVSNARASQKMAPLPSTSLGPTGEQMLGLTHSALRYLLEQFPGARKATSYEWKHKDPPQPPTPTKENPSGSARTEPYHSKSEYDMFSWLASRHRKKPHPNVGFILPPELAAEAHLMGGTSRRATSLDLPMAMRFRHLAKNAREAVGVYASGIHGRGLFCKREIACGEMVIEYAGEEIRAILTDYREKFYDNKGIGCYMFRIDDDLVVDATMKGNAARFINHSCDPNCYSKIVDILGKKHIIIFALRKIFPGEELTYDYKFPIEDVKIQCHCGARKCKKYMN
eukprot:TRINITY_DN10472_c0_g1_i1.p1 TRINITY_DN10472_c0_g1~~TRINITY_DN10472_c0_g1_i1.p1  ORF type:complete len:2203 (+),score=428.08 TRINITY_DN10472_c0_g1_i1:62-6670(+)